jgi:hypothetical protein
MVIASRKRASLRSAGGGGPVAGRWWGVHATTHTPLGYIRDKLRWCLWLGTGAPADLRPEVRHDLYSADHTCDSIVLGIASPLPSTFLLCSRGAGHDDRYRLRAPSNQPHDIIADARDVNRVRWLTWRKPLLRKLKSLEPSPAFRMPASVQLMRRFRDNVFSILRTSDIMCPAHMICSLPPLSCPRPTLTLFKEEILVSPICLIFWDPFPIDEQTRQGPELKSTFII